MQGCSRVVHGKDSLSIYVSEFAVYLPDSLPGKEPGHGMPPQGDDQFRGKELDLLLQPGTALLYFLGKRVPVLGGSALDDVRYVYFISFQIDCCKQLIEKLASGADERSAMLVFVESRAFTDKHDSRAFGSLTRDDVGAALAETTGHALLNPVMQ